MDRPRYITWDFDNTLARRPGGWSGAILTALQREVPGMDVRPEIFRPHLQSGFPWHTPENGHQGLSASEWWGQLEQTFSTAVHVATGLDLLTASRVSRRVRECFLEHSQWELFGDTLTVLDQLSARGWSHLILSNHVPELAQLVEALGLKERVLAVFNSGVTGHEKPNPKAFEDLFAIYPSARNGWMVGDSHHSDVLGAEGVGMRAIQVRHQTPKAALHCPDLRGVAANLE